MNERQKRFIAEYVKDLNATQAYIRAGYSPNGASQAAEKLLRNAEIQAAIAAIQTRISDRLEITAEKVIRDLEDARRNAMATLDWGPAVRAAELMGKHIGMFVDRNETVITERNVIRVPEVSDDADQWQQDCAPKAH